MRRRHLLRVCGLGAAAVAGCLGDADGTGSDGTPTAAPTAAPTADPTTTETTDRPTTLPEHTTFPPDTDDGIGSDGAARLPARLGVATPPTGRLADAFDVGATVAVAAPRITDSRTARIEVTLTNEGSTTRTLTYTRETCDLDLLRSRPPAGGRPLLLVAAGALDRAAEDCPRPDPRDLECGIPATDHEVTLAPGERHRRRYDLWVDPTVDGGADGCLTPGVHRFERSYRADGTAATLSFELAVGT
jgi:hypothetical protein